MATYKTIKYIVPVEVVEHTDSINALADVDTSTATPTEGQTIKWNGTNWVPADIEEASGTQKAMFGFGHIGVGYTNVTNLVSSSGVVASDTTGVGTSRDRLAAAGYGGDKAIFGFGFDSIGYRVSATNLVSSSGVVATDTTGVGTSNRGLAAAGFGGDKAIFGFGNHGVGSLQSTQITNKTNLVSNTGVVSTDTTGVGTAREYLAAAGYGEDKAIFGFGFGSSTSVSRTNITNLVSNTGVVASDTTGVGSARQYLAGAGYGGDKAIFGFGNMQNETNITNLVSNTGVVSTDTTGVGTSRTRLSAAGYGGDKAIFGFGIYWDSSIGYYGSDATQNVTNLVSNTGVVASDSTGVGTARSGLAAAGYSSTA